MFNVGGKSWNSEYISLWIFCPNGYNQTWYVLQKLIKISKIYGVKFNL